MSETLEKKFGFTINPSRLIDYDSSDRKVREYVTLRNQASSSVLHAADAPQPARQVSMHRSISGG
jgi:hypothetical protein